MTTPQQQGNTQESESMKSTASADGHSSAHEPHSRESERSASSGPANPRTNASSLTRKATDPRTPSGKRRSRYNAVKSGIFAKVVLLEGESPAEYGSLLKGLREDLKPQGTLEAALVENLASLLWRKRRYLRAEVAEIAKAAEFKPIDSLQTLIREAWDQSRAGESSGGMLRHSSNPFVLQEAIQALTIFRTVLENFGFQKDKDPWLLRKLYGLDHDDAVPLSVFKLYQALAAVATDPPKGDEAPASLDELKKQALAILDAEIKRLETLKEWQQIIVKQRAEYESIAALIPPQDALDRLIRYEAHLSREFDRTLSQLERLQRIRLGYAAPPTVRLEI
jgi:hypothetical protein